ncbi:ankyrin repeat domain-containing protein 26-like [Megalops cyprinoides]|uniref:ankyrin repeat domain-containing protein 26-like n=1 Tax=Megalops cyprinoides TaxID=118141 RepID=UPI00186512FC|nr:ankyrin repeat domain-containing protein 26-like [Megalops cyprinoides]
MVPSSGLWWYCAHSPKWRLMAGAVVGFARHDVPFVGYDIKEQDIGKLHRAAFNGDLAKIKRYAKKYDLNQVDKENRTALHIACAYGHSNIVRFLVENGAKLDLCDKQGRSPLMKAVQCQKESCAAILLKSGADPNLRDVDGNTALHLAAWTPRVSMAELLLQHKVNVNAQNQEGNTPLILAVMENQVEMVVVLLRSGADAEARDQHGWTSLMRASVRGQARIAWILSQHIEERGGKEDSACAFHAWPVMIQPPVCSPPMLGEERTRTVQCFGSLMEELKSGSLYQGGTIGQEVFLFGIRQVQRIVVMMIMTGKISMFLPNEDQDSDSITETYGEMSLQELGTYQQEEKSGSKDGEDDNDDWEKKLQALKAQAASASTNQTYAEKMTGPALQSHDRLINELLGAVSWLEKECVGAREALRESQELRRRQEEQHRREKEQLELEVKSCIINMRQLEKEQDEAQRQQQELLKTHLLTLQGNRRERRRMLKLLQESEEKYDQSERHLQNVRLALTREVSQLEETDRQLEADVAALRQHVETSMVPRSQVELYCREIEGQARQLVQGNLAEVNRFLLNQAAAHETLNQKRDAVEASLRAQVQQLADELARVKTQQDRQNQAAELEWSDRCTNATSCLRIPETYLLGFEPMTSRRSTTLTWMLTKQRLTPAVLRLQSAAQTSSSSTAASSKMRHGWAQGAIPPMGRLELSGSTYGVTMGLSGSSSNQITGLSDPPSNQIKEPNGTSHNVATLDYTA